MGNEATHKHAPLGDIQPCGPQTASYDSDSFFHHLVGNYVAQFVMAKVCVHKTHVRAASEAATGDGWVGVWRVHGKSRAPVECGEDRLDVAMCGKRGV
mmetsp:Transcript_66875/g.108444  ORF Transcript_66875/g.108444 Transcript_66875/m.108444 type:complete len:98 (-) Transcript_66875:1421-1714(-)